MATDAKPSPISRIRWLNAGSGLQRGFNTFTYSERDLDFCRSSFEFLNKMIPNARVPICRLSADEINRRALDAVATARRPYFLVLNYMDPHLPLYVPSAYRQAGYRAFRPFSDYARFDAAHRSGGSMSPNLLKHFSKNYRIAVRYMDDRLGALFPAIDTRRTGRTQSLPSWGITGSNYVSTTPSFTATRSTGKSDRGGVKQPVSTACLYSALLRAARIRTSAPHVLPYTADAAVPPVLSLHEPSMRDERVPSPITERRWSVFEKNMHFIRGERGREEMYQVDTDPEELDDIVIQERIQPQRVQLRRSLLDRFVTRNGIREKQRRLRSLGYMQ